jgi:hypothetical protein
LLFGVDLTSLDRIVHHVRLERRRAIRADLLIERTRRGSPAPDRTASGSASRQPSQQKTSRVAKGDPARRRLNVLDRSELERPVQPQCDELGAFRQVVAPVSSGLCSAPDLPALPEDRVSKKAARFAMWPPQPRLLRGAVDPELVGDDFRVVLRGLAAPALRETPGKACVAARAAAFGDFASAVEEPFFVP